MSDDVAELTLEQAGTYVLDECRMVLPGIQALFGFQMVAVFNSKFAEALTPGEQLVHLAAIACVIVAIAMVMAPAALHRQREPDRVSKRFVHISSRLLMWGMVPLALGTSFDTYLVARVIIGNRGGAVAVAAAALGAFTGLWWLLPSRVRLEQRPAGNILKGR